ncbi:MAG: hypothetical protein ACXVHX_26715 [Solirubrobacteraceae bacterium]
MSVAIATFGDISWSRLAHERAFPSALSQGVPVLMRHAETLHEARNAVLDCVETEFVIFLDADDELGSFYVERMDEIEADVRVPMVCYIGADGRAHRPRFPKVAGHTHDCAADCLPYGNWVVIGAAVRTELLRKVGGFRDFPVYEDWDLWLRCHLAGASFGVTRAVYRAHVRHDSRNRGPARELKHATHQAIARANGVPVPA